MSGAKIHAGLFGSWYYYGGNPNELDKDIQRQLIEDDYIVSDHSGKGYKNKTKYPIGTVVPIRKQNRLFYLLALTHITEYGRAKSSEEDLKTALL